MPTRLFLAAYRVRPGHDDEVLPHLREEMATLRARGHVTSRTAPVCTTAGGAYLVVAEWATAHSVDDAHADDVIVETWHRKDRLLEYLAPAALDGADVEFASFERIEEI
jgi:hypothetical protein